MAERDVKVVYKTREIPPGYQPRIPTALDPYDYQYDGEPIRRARSTRERDSNSTFDSASVVSTPRSVRSSYTVDSKRGSRGAYVDIERSTDRDRSRPRSIRDRADGSESGYRGNVVLDQDFDRRSAWRSRPDLEFNQQRSSKERLDVNYGRNRSRSREYVVDQSYNSSRDSVQKQGGTYVMDTRGEVDIIMPGRENDTSYGPRGSRYSYDTPSSRTRIYYGDERRGPATSADGVVLVQRNIAPPSRQDRTRLQFEREDNIRFSQRTYDQDDDWRIVDTMRDTHLASADAGNQRRSRAPTQSSEESFVMVSSTRDSGQTVRSAMRRNDYAPSELRRRRSRSISFRESETVSHEVGDRRHERPGAEADICGPYLKRRSERDDYDADDYEDARAQPKRPSRRSEIDRRDDDDRYQEPYGPQVDNRPRKRESSRRRRHRDDDDASYYSERVDKTYTKETRYI